MVEMTWSMQRDAEGRPALRATWITPAPAATVTAVVPVPRNTPLPVAS